MVRRVRDGVGLTRRHVTSRRAVRANIWPTNHVRDRHLTPDLQNILRQSYDYLTIMPNLRSTYYGRQIYQASYEGRKAFLTYDSLAKL